MAVGYINFKDIISFQEEFKRGKISEKVGGMITNPTNYDPKLSPDNKQMIFIGTGCLKGKEQVYYEKIGEKCWELFLEIFPEAEKYVIWKKLDTPKLVEAYAGEYGNIIGVAQTIDQIYEKRPKQKTPIENLYIVGAEAGGHGIGAELAADSALELFDILLHNN